MQLMARYLHTFLFRCPHCGEPVEVARKSDEAAREQLDAQPFSLDCLSCRKLFGAPDGGLNRTALPSCRIEPRDHLNEVGLIVAANGLKFEPHADARYEI